MSRKKSICRKTEADMGSGGKREDLSHLWFYFFLDAISCPFYEYLCPILYRVNACRCNYCFPSKDAVHSKTNPIQRYQNVKKYFNVTIYFLNVSVKILGSELNMMIDLFPCSLNGDTKIKTSIFPVLSTEPLSVISSCL